MSNLELGGGGGAHLTVGCQIGTHLVGRRMSDWDTPCREDIKLEHTL